MMQSLATIFRRVFWLLLAVAIVYFSVLNRHPITLNLEPLLVKDDLPAFWLLFAGIFIGLGVAVWAGSVLRLQGFARRRKAERRASYLEEQVSSLSEEAHKTRAKEGHERLSAGNGSGGSSG